jgi:hypothetical protein
MNEKEKNKLAEAKKRAANAAAEAATKKSEGKERFRMDIYYQQLKDEGKSDKEIHKAFVKYYADKYQEKPKDPEFIKWRFETYKKIAEVKAEAAKKIAKK